MRIPHIKITGSKELADLEGNKLSYGVRVEIDGKAVPVIGTVSVLFHPDGLPVVHMMVTGSIEIQGNVDRRRIRRCKND